MFKMKKGHQDGHKGGERITLLYPNPSIGQPADRQNDRLIGIEF